MLLCLANPILTLAKRSLAVACLLAAAETHALYGVEEVATDPSNQGDPVSFQFLGTVQTVHNQEPDVVQIEPIAIASDVAAYQAIDMLAEQLGNSLPPLQHNGLMVKLGYPILVDYDANGVTILDAKAILARWKPGSVFNFLLPCLLPRKLESCEAEDLKEYFSWSKDKISSEIKIAEHKKLKSKQLKKKKKKRGEERRQASKAIKERNELRAKSEVLQALAPLPSPPCCWITDIKKLEKCIQYQGQLLKQEQALANSMQQEAYVNRRQGITQQGVLVHCYLREQDPSAEDHLSNGSRQEDPLVVANELLAIHVRHLPQQSIFYEVGGEMGNDAWNLTCEVNQDIPLFTVVKAIQGVDTQAIFGDAQCTVPLIATHPIFVGLPQGGEFPSPLTAQELTLENLKALGEHPLYFCFPCWSTTKESTEEEVKKLQLQKQAKEQEMDTLMNSKEAVGAKNNLSDQIIANTRSINERIKSLEQALHHALPVSPQMEKEDSKCFQRFQRLSALQNEDLSTPYKKWVSQYQTVPLSPDEAPLHEEPARSDETGDPPVAATVFQHPNSSTTTTTSVHNLALASQQVTTPASWHLVVVAIGITMCVAVGKHFWDKRVHAQQDPFEEDEELDVAVDAEAGNPQEEVPEATPAVDIAA